MRRARWRGARGAWGCAGCGGRGGRAGAAWAEARRARKQCVVKVEGWWWWGGGSGVASPPQSTSRGPVTPNSSITRTGIATSPKEGKHERPGLQILQRLLRGMRGARAGVGGPKRHNNLLLGRLRGLRVGAGRGVRGRGRVGVRGARGRGGRACTRAAGCAERERGARVSGIGGEGGGIA